MSARRERPTSKEQYVSCTCDQCGKKCGNYLTHYDLIRCSCGKFYWALQPKRNGPLMLFVWPGDYRTNPQRQEAA